MLEELNVVEWLQKPYSNNTRTWDVRLRTNPEGVWTLDILAVNPNADPILHGRMLSIRIPAALAIVNRASLQAHNAENARMESCIAELEAENAALKNAASVTSDEGTEVIGEYKQRITALEAQVAEMQPVWEAVGRLEEYLRKMWQRSALLHMHHGEIICRIGRDDRHDSDAEESADTLPAAISAALASVGESNVQGT